MRNAILGFRFLTIRKARFAFESYILFLNLIEYSDTRTISGMFVLRKFICRQSLSSFLNHRRKKPRGLQRRFFSIVVLKNANKTTKYVALHLHRMMCDCINNKERDLFLLSGLLYSSFQHSTSYKMSRAYRHVFMS